MPVTSQESHQSCHLCVRGIVTMPVTSQESHQSCICVLEVSLAKPVTSQVKVISHVFVC